MEAISAVALRRGGVARAWIMEILCWLLRGVQSSTGQDFLSNRSGFDLVSNRTV